MAVITLFKNLDRPWPARDQLDGLAHDLASESAEVSAEVSAVSAEVSAVSAAVSAETHPSIAIRRAAPILQRLEAGQ
jgi:hypothetical protein